MEKVTEEQFLEWCLKFIPPDAKIRKVEKDGYVFFQTGELNIDKAARLLLPYIKFSSEKDECDKEGGSK